MRANPVETLKSFRQIKEARDGMYVDTYNNYLEMALGGVSENANEVCEIDIATGRPKCRSAGKYRRQARKARRQTRRSKRKANRKFKGGRRY